MVNTVILGIDPGYAIVGYGVIGYHASRFALGGYGAITTEAGLPFETRLGIIYEETDKLIKLAKPDAIAIEELFFTTNQKTAIYVSMARGVLILAAVRNNIPIFEYTPLQVKQSVVGYGRAEKKQVMEMTRLLLKLDEIPKPDDAADALAIAICHAHTSGSALNGNFAAKAK